MARFFSLAPFCGCLPIPEEPSSNQRELEILLRILGAVLSFLGTPEIRNDPLAQKSRYYNECVASMQKVSRSISFNFKLIFSLRMLARSTCACGGCSSGSSTSWPCLKRARRSPDQAWKSASLRFELRGMVARTALSLWCAPDASSAFKACVPPLWSRFPSRSELRTRKVTGFSKFPHSASSALLWIL